MGTYKAKLDSGVSVKDGFIIEWAVASQEVLAHAYEELGMTDVIEKLSTEPKKETKKTKSNRPENIEEPQNYLCDRLCFFGFFFRLNYKNKR